MFHSHDTSGCVQQCAWSALAWAQASFKNNTYQLQSTGAVVLQSQVGKEAALLVGFLKGRTGKP